MSEERILMENAEDIMVIQTPNEIIIDEEVADIVMPCTDEISPYDSAFPIKFLSDGLRARMEQAERATKAIYDAVVKESPILAQTEQALQKGCRYVVDATESTLEAIERGKIKLTTEKSGLMFAQIRESNGIMVLNYQLSERNSVRV